MAPDTLRLGLIGAGWITPAHLDALDRLGRTRAELMDATAAVLRFTTGAVGTVADTRRQATHTVGISLSCDRPRITIRRTSSLPGGWSHHRGWWFRPDPPAGT